MGSPIVTPTENVSPTSRSSDNSIELPISPTESPIMPTSTPSTPITPDPTNTPTKTQIESEELDRGKKVPFIGG